MCGRFTLTADPELLAEAFPGVAPPVEFAPRYNIAPTQPVVVIPNDGQNQMHLFRWGLIPSWAKDISIGSRLINARGETIHEKPSFRTAYRRRRCLIVADGFYEWKKEADGKTKTPWYIYLKNRQPFAFAGLWEVWHGPDGSVLPTATIITTTPNDFMASLHNRMPVILPPDTWADWLTPAEIRAPENLELLQPLPSDAMDAHPVSRAVNRPTNDGPDLILPLAA